MLSGHQTLDRAVLPKEEYPSGVLQSIKPNQGTVMMSASPPILRTGAGLSGLPDTVCPKLVLTYVLT